MLLAGPGIRNPCALLLTVTTKYARSAELATLLCCAIGGSRSIHLVATRITRWRESMSAATDAVLSTLRDYVAAVNAGDAGAYVATLASDVVMCPPGQERFSGHEAARSWIQDGFFDLFDISFDATFDRIIEAEGEMMAPGSFKLDLSPKDGGDEMRLTGTFFNIFREVEPGEWKYSWLVWNFQQPLA